MKRQGDDPSWSTIGTGISTRDVARISSHNDTLVTNFHPVTAEYMILQVWEKLKEHWHISSGCKLVLLQVLASVHMLT